ncbi:MAG: CarD family transcriptional regulator [Bacteriovoracia bacterium]
MYPKTYKVGDKVSYGLHGTCLITAIEVKELTDGPVEFYQIKAVRNTIGNKGFTLKDTNILIPVASADTKGLRPLMTKEECEQILRVLEDPEYYFELEETWVSKQKKLEEVLRKEGFLGLAKVVGHLFVVMSLDAVPSSEVVRFYDTVFKVLVREISDVMGLTIKETDTLVTKALRNKASHFTN